MNGGPLARLGHLDAARRLGHLLGRVQDLGRLLILVGGLAALVGVLLMIAPRVPWLGRLPGDFVWRRGSVTIYFPLTTSIVVSIGLTVLLHLFRRR